MSGTFRDHFLGLLLNGTVSATAAHAQGDATPAELAETVTLDQLTVESAGARPEPQGGVTVGYLTKQTRSATKTSTPVIDIPQSITIVAREQFLDQNYQNLTEQLRFVPGLIPAQGESNRDQVLIRGQNTSA